MLTIGRCEVDAGRIYHKRDAHKNTDAVQALVLYLSRYDRCSLLVAYMKDMYGSDAMPSDHPRSSWNDIGY